MSKSIKRFLLASVLSFATLGAALATEGPPPGNGGSNGHASAAPACGYECPVLAGGASGAGGDIRASLTDRGRSGQVPRLWRPVLAGDTGPGGPGDNNGRSSAALSKGGAKFLVAGGRVGGLGDF